MDKIFGIIKKQAKRFYIQQGMIYFYSSKAYKTITTLLFDINNYFWTHKFYSVLKYIPVWKLCYLFSEADFRKKIKGSRNILTKKCLGKVLQITINEESYIMLLLYCIGNEKIVLRKHTKLKCFFVIDNNTPSLDFSKRIDYNSYISQGEGGHRYECEEQDLSTVFVGENYYKYK